jgi:hypothetical protein
MQRSSRLAAAQNISPAGSSVPSTAFGAQTYQIRVCATAAVNYRVGDGTPTAVATDTLLPANTIEYVTCSPGQKLAAVGTATVNITEIA